MININHKHSFVAVTSRTEHTRWLATALKDEGEIVVADQRSLERVRQILDLSGAQVIFVDLAQDTLRQDTGLIEGLIAAKPLLSVIALAEKADNALVLAAMRSGARDFVTTDSRSGELVNLVHRLQDRAPVARMSASTTGKITALASARPGADSPMLALHLALAMQCPGKERNSLLLDLGAPPGDTLMYLGLSSSYNFVDAVRSLRRLDATLIDSAFAKHESGLNLIAMPDKPDAIGEITSADIYVLLGTLRRYFSHIVINLGGVPPSDFLNLFLNNSDNILVLVEQSVPSCTQNLQLVRHMVEQKIRMASTGLVVDRYLPKMPPDAQSVSRGFDLPLYSKLPPSGMARLNMMNSGESLFQCAPNDPYTLAVRKLAEKLTGSEVSISKSAAGMKFLSTIRSWFDRVES
ncbi:MAG: AAA family ATPase [Methylococcales bacterium]